MSNQEFIVNWKGINPDQLYSRKQVAQLLGVKPQTLSIWQIHQRENLPVIKIGRHCKYIGNDILAYINTKRIIGKNYDQI